ncbi:MAG TPA: type II secretion system protein GspM [Deltaproteobacteria bacterium]|jgi:type II secretory pathway component PulM|nr:type II secretion system protein GspM [Deltaproteobacteria bacterium]HOI07479.1 type II secretion system protein GspM [Deltaproteobacteria bacterium]
MQQKIEQYLKQIVQYFKSLTKREQIVLAGVAALLGVFIIVGGVVSPVMSYQSRLAKSVQTKDDQLRKVYGLSAQLKEARARGGEGASPANFTLFGFIEELASKARVNDRIEYMKPVSDPADASKEVVELKIRAVYQEDVINLLYDIEHSPHSIIVKKLNIKRVEADSKLDVTFQVVRYG